MGLPRAAISLLLRESARRPFSGTVATLGRQHVYATADDIHREAARHQVSLAAASIELHREPKLAQQNFVSDDCLFQLLGFSESVRIDRSDYEDAEELLDLNAEHTPHHLRQRFDLIIDSGTLEHIFDVPAVFRHLCNMVKPGGRIIHLTPSSNCVEHGFYSVSPTLFADYYSAAGCHLEDIFLCRWPERPERGMWLVYDYLNAPNRFIPLGRLGRSVWFTYAAVTILDGVAPGIPQQSFYTSTWRAAEESGSEASVEPADSRAARLLKLVEGRPRLTSAANASIRAWRGIVNGLRHRRGTLPYPFVGKF
ncbi:MAG: methyltransferase domain-containing protein [Planctomycetales bacterium]|nr:methyltransferase domain-containing protein [Planctomycetales bacterium]